MIRAKANGNVIHADDDAARILIDAGIYEEYTGSQSAEVKNPPDLAAVNAASPAATPKTRRRAKSK